MLSTDELLQTLDIELGELKSASMILKPKKAEQCVVTLLEVIKSQNETIKALRFALLDVNKRLTLHVKAEGK